MVANPFKDIQVFYDGFGNTAVNWILDERFDDPYPHYFELQFSKSATGFNSNEFEVVDSGKDLSFLRDTKYRTEGYAGTAFYRVGITTPAGTYLSSVKGISGNVDKRNLGILRELLRKENLVFRLDRGATAGYLFKRRYYGPRCVCTDSNTDTVVSLSCTSCSGTGFKYGYFPGVEFPILISSPENAQTEISEVGSLNLRAIAARCLPFPIADAKDLWMEKDTSRVYEVRKTTIVSRYSYVPVACQIELRELAMVDSISLALSSMRGVAVSEVKPTNTYYAPIIIADNPTVDLTLTKPKPEVGTVGLVSAANSPFAELLASGTVLSDRDKIKENITAPLTSIKPELTQSIPALAPSKPTTNITIDVKPDNTVVCDNDLDGGNY